MFKVVKELNASKIRRVYTLKLIETWKSPLRYGVYAYMPKPFSFVQRAVCPKKPRK